MKPKENIKRYLEKRLMEERFVTLMNREQFDYTQWQQNLFEGMTVRELSTAAMQYIDINNKIN